MHCSLFKFILVLNSALLFWKSVALKFLPDTSENLLCSMLAHIKNVLMLDATCCLQGQ
jgi:hypothetical protein